MRHTHLWTVINEETLETLKHEDGSVATFICAKHADNYASNNLNLWRVVEHNFWHENIHHKPNTFKKEWNY